MDRERVGQADERASVGAEKQHLMYENRGDVRSRIYKCSGSVDASRPLIPKLETGIRRGSAIRGRRHYYGDEPICLYFYRAYRSMQL